MNPRTTLVTAALAAVGIACLALGSQRARAQQAPPASLDSVAWLAGTWEGGSGDTQDLEYWMKPAAGTMLGTSRSVRGDRTVFREFLLLERLPDGIYMTVTHVGEKMAPREPKPETFRLTAATDTELTFQTDDPKYPKKITYRKQGADVLTARVDSYRNDRPVNFEFAFRRSR